MNRSIICCFIFLLTSLVYGQNSNRIVINLDIDARQFKNEDLNNIPFDQPFFIKGTTKDKKIKSVKVKYKIQGGFEDKHYFVEGKPRDADGYVSLGYHKLHGQSFIFVADMLHSNEIYEFIFDFQEELDISEKKNNLLRLNILTSIDKTFTFDKPSIPPSDIKALMDNIEQEIKAATDDKELFDKDNNKINDLSNLLITDQVLKSSFVNITTVHSDIYEAYKKLIYVDFVNTREEIVYKILEEFDVNENSIIMAINLILNNAHFKDLIKEPVNSAISSEVKLKDVLEFIRNDYNRSAFNLTRNQSNFPNNLVSDLKSTNSYLFSILLGDLKLKGISVEPSVSYDVSSIELFLSTFIRLQNLKKANGRSLIPNNALDHLNNHLIAWIKQVDIIKTKLKLIEEEKVRNVQILNNIYSQFSLSANADTAVDIETSDSPYLGIDFGVIVAPEINSTFLFEGINFHLSPVNRRAKFSDLKGFDKWLKRVSFSVGVAQRIGDYNDNYKNLIGVGSPFAGVGLRINRMIRVNGGVLFYKTESTNPVINTTNVNATYFLSASVDIKLKDALKIIGNFIN